jgi:hypothetical protein
VRKPGTTLFDDRSAHVDRFGWLLVVTVVTIAALALVDLTTASGQFAADAAAVVTTALVGSALLLALRASGLARRWQRVADILILLVILVLVLILAFGSVADTGRSTADTGASPLVLVILSALAPLVVVRRLLRHRRITTGTLMGAISVYLLIPIAFFYAFIFVDYLQTEPFFGQPEPTTSFMYYSLTNVTTAGYGDLTAVSPLGRLMANAESMIGQIYLVTFVAMLVGLFAQRMIEERREKSPAASAGEDRSREEDGGKSVTEALGAQSDLPADHLPRS